MILIILNKFPSNVSCDCITGQPLYLHDLVTEYKPSRPLRSENLRLLSRPTGLTSALGSRAFTRASVTVWNNLQEDARKADSLRNFKTKLKTLLFSRVTV